LTAAEPATQTTDLPAPQPFDLASLPPLHSITAGTDIRSLLGSGVPAELTRAALRRAWVSDPAICGFIGIAESQWDFNDPTAMPGFGPLGAGDDIPSLLAQIFDKAKHACETTVDAAETAPPAVADHAFAQGGGSADEFQRESVPSTTRDPSDGNGPDAGNTAGDPAADSEEG
jgi:hypothetical protein